MSDSEMSSCREEERHQGQRSSRRCLMSRGREGEFLPLHQRSPPRRRPSPCTGSKVKGQRPEHTHPQLHCVLTHSLRLRLFLREHPQDKVRLLRGLERRRDDQVLARREAEPGAHLSQVDEGLGASAGRMAQEEVLLHVDAGTASVLRDRWTLAPCWTCVCLKVWTTHLLGDLLKTQDITRWLLGRPALTLRCLC